MFDILLNHNTLVLFGIIFFGIALGSIKTVSYTHLTLPTIA